MVARRRPHVYRVAAECHRFLCGLNVASPPSSLGGTGRHLCKVVSHCGKPRSALGSDRDGENPGGWGIPGRYSGCHTEDSREHHGGSHNERGSSADAGGTGATPGADAGTAAGTGEPEKGVVSGLTPPLPAE